MRTMLVIGGGNFGKILALNLTELQNEVMLIDIDEEVVHKLEPFVTRAQIGDCTDKDVLAEVGVRNFDICFVCISSSFQSSLEITSLLKELGASHVVAISEREIHAKLLKKIGADDVIFIEADMAKRTAIRYSTRGAFDYFEMSLGYGIMEIAVPHDWVGHNIRELNIRTKHHVNVIGVRENEHILPFVSADHVFKAHEHILIVGEQQDILNLATKKL